MLGRVIVRVYHLHRLFVGVLSCHLDQYRLRNALERPSDVFKLVEIVNIQLRYLLKVLEIRRTELKMLPVIKSLFGELVVALQVQSFGYVVIFFQT